MKKILIAILSLPLAAYAAQHHIKMLDIGADNQTMVFEPAVLHIAAGDSITFLPSNKGHHVESKSIPEGAEHFKSELDQEFTITLHQEGIYLYTCPPHSMMNMNGVIIVGTAHNLEDSKTYAQNRMERRAMSNKGRLMSYLDSITPSDTNTTTAPNSEQAAEKPAQ